jgi:hypothetical protein
MLEGVGGARRWSGQHKYQRVTTVDAEEEGPPVEEHSDAATVEFEQDDYRSDSEVLRNLKTFRKRSKRRVGIVIMSAFALILFLYWAVL